MKIYRAQKQKVCRSAQFLKRDPILYFFNYSKAAISVRIYLQSWAHDSKNVYKKHLEWFTICMKQRHTDASASAHGQVAVEAI